jgi:pimeloyl-ACP methyl ester carboxylesterase
LSIASIARARGAYESGDLRERLARYHDEPDSAFYGWNDAWLDPAFRDWNIERDIESIRAPLLAIQGVDDEYGTLDQVHRIARRVAHAHVLELDACGHSPHRDQADRVVRETMRFTGSR